MARIAIAALGAIVLAVPGFASFSGTDLFLPSVGRGPGASLSQWYTTVWITNPSPSTATVQVVFLERKQANPSPVIVTVSVPAGDTVRYADAIPDIFHFERMGALRFVSDQKISVACRIFNLPAGGTDRDTQGQDYAGIPASFGISKGQSTQLLGVYQTSTDKNVSPFRYSFGLAESGGGTASVHVKAYDGTGAVVAEKDYGPLGAYEVEYYPIEDLSPSISSQNLRLEVAMTDGTGKIIAVGSSVANQSNDGTTFEMQFADSLLGSSRGGLAAVNHDDTLAGTGTAESPLGLADNAVTASKVAPAQLVKSVNGLKDDVTIAAGPNITLTPSGNTLTIAATGGGGGGGTGVPSVNGITSAVMINAAGSSTVATAGGTITVTTPSSLTPSGAAGGSLSGTYPNPAIATGAVGSTQIADLAVTDAKVASGVAYSKLADAPTSLPPSGAAGGSLAGAYPNPAIAKYAVTETQIADGAITDPKVSKSGIDYGKLFGAPTSLPPNGAAGGSLTGGYPNPEIARYAVTTMQIADGAVTDAKVSKTGLDYAKIFGAPTSLPPSGPAGGDLGGTYPNPTLKLPYSGSTSVGLHAFRVNSSGGSGLYGTSISAMGVMGESTTGIGVYGGGGYEGVWGYSFAGGSYAGSFSGNVLVTGTLTKGGGAFKIDHPLDPERKYLYHSFVESPDMMNIYNGIVTTDANGDATVELPTWFEALNRDFRYQLTVIGRFADAIVSQEVEHSRFAIKTNLANIKVSWQVTGIRKDPFAEQHRIPVEEDKPAVEQGTYLHPTAYGQPEEKSVEWTRHPELMRRLKEEREKTGAATSGTGTQVRAVLSPEKGERQ